MGARAVTAQSQSQSVSRQSGPDQQSQQGQQ
jgi:hypothetical protein